MKKNYRGMQPRIFKVDKNINPGLQSGARLLPVLGSLLTQNVDCSI